MVVAPIVVEIWVAPKNICPVHTRLIFQTDATMRFNLETGQ
jgi:hypothetical protein